MVGACLFVFVSYELPSEWKESFICGARKSEFLPISILLHKDSNEAVGTHETGERTFVSQMLTKKLDSSFFYFVRKYKRIFHISEY